MIEGENITFKINGKIAASRVIDTKGFSILLDLAITSSGTDTTLPSLTITYPTENTIVTTQTITVSGTASDDVAVVNVTVNGIPATGTISWSAEVTLTPGTNNITAIATDNAGNTITKNIIMTYAPVNAGEDSNDSANLALLGTEILQEYINITNVEIQQMTDSNEFAKSPIWGMDKIFYASNISGNFDIFVMDKDGTNKTQITNSTADEYPSDSWISRENNSNALKILYISNTNGNSDIWLANGDGSNKIQLTKDNYENIDPVLVYVPEPVISGMQPSGAIDNNLPRFNASYYSYYGNISKVNVSVDGVDVSLYANISTSYMSYIPTVPFAMGNHNFTLYLETDKYTDFSITQLFDIRYIYNLSTGCAHTTAPTISANISIGYGDISSVIMILDGINITSNAAIHSTYIKYVPTVPLDVGIHTVSLEVKTTKGFTDIKNLTFFVNSPCDISSRGRSRSGPGSQQNKIIFASNHSGNFDLWIMNLDGSGKLQMTQTPFNEHSPAWIESKVVYVSDKSGNKDLWSMNVNGSNNKQLTNSIHDDDMPSSSYIGGIIYVSGKDGITHLEAINTDGTGNVQITNGSTYVTEPAHSPESYGIIFSSSYSGEIGIYRMNFIEAGPKVKSWELEEGYSLYAFAIDMYSEKAWIKLHKNGVLKDDCIIRVGDDFSINDGSKVILTANLNNIHRDDSINYFELGIVNVTQYSSFDGTLLFTNKTKILVNKIITTGNSSPTPLTNLTINSPINGTTVTIPTITISGTASSTAIASVTVNGIPATGTTSWNADINLTEGANIITAVATGTSGNTATATITITYTPAAGTLVGDVNSDGILSSVDALMALQMSAGNIAQNLVADVSGDGSVTALDALMILQASVGAIVL